VARSITWLSLVIFSLLLISPAHSQATKRQSALRKLCTIQPEGLAEPFITLGDKQVPAVIAPLPIILGDVALDFDPYDSANSAMREFLPPGSLIEVVRARHSLPEPEVHRGIFLTQAHDSLVILSTKGEVVAVPINAIPEVQNSIRLWMTNIQVSPSSVRNAVLSTREKREMLKLLDSQKSARRPSVEFGVGFMHSFGSSLTPSQMRENIVLGEAALDANFLARWTLTLDSSITKRTLTALREQLVRVKALPQRVASVSYFVDNRDEQWLEALSGLEASRKAYIKRHGWTSFIWWMGNRSGHNH
jgi:hypothetical protein